MREDVVERAEKRCDGERDADDQSRIGDGLLARRPGDMAHFDARFFEIFSEFHFFALVFNQKPLPGLLMTI